MRRMATRKAPPAADISGNGWDGAAGPPDAPAGASMPPRAAVLPTQNGQAMREVFAHLLDEDAPPPKKRR